MVGLFKRAPKDLGELIQDYRRQPSRGRALALCRKLAEQRVVIGVKELPPGISPGDSFVLAEAITVQALQTTTPDGSQPAYAVFTSDASLAQRSPASFPLRMDGSDVLEAVAADPRYAALVVDPGPNYAILPRGWVEQAHTELAGG